MISKQQYELLLPYYDQLKLYEKRKSWDAGDGIYYIYEQIYGSKVNTTCGGCKSMAIQELANALNEYERSMQSM
jgi:hypothetical protein